MDEIKNKVEAVLFTTGRFMNVDEISRLCGVGSIGLVRDALKGLVQDYSKRISSLEIFEEKGRYKLNIRKKYSYLTTNLLNDSELDVPTQETLAIVAYKQPILQSDIIKIRGSSAYDHIKILREEEFVTSEKYGRTRLLKLAPKFFDYFDVVEDGLKSQFKEIENKIGTSEEIQEKLQQNKDDEEKQVDSKESSSEVSDKESDKSSEDKSSEDDVEEVSDDPIDEEEEEQKLKKKKKQEVKVDLEKEIMELIGDNQDDSQDQNPDGGSVPEGSISFD